MRLICYGLAAIVLRRFTVIIHRLKDHRRGMGFFRSIVRTTPILILLFACISLAAPSGNMTVLVTDKATGEPIADAEVSAGKDKAATNEFGQCALGTALHGDNFAIEVFKDNYVTMEVDWRDLKPDQELPGQISVAMVPGDALGGKIVDEGGKPVSNAKLELWGTEPVHKDGEVYPQLHVFITADAAGKWVTRSAPSQFNDVSYSITAGGFFHDNSYTSIAPRLFAQLRDRSLVLTIQHAVALSGMVLDPAGQPVQGAMITTGGEDSGTVLSRARSNSDGNFTLANLQPGKISLGVTSADFAPQIVATLAPSTQPTQVHMQPGTPMKFHVVDRAGNPIGGVNIFIAQYHHAHYVRYSMKTNASGNVTWKGGPPDEIVMNIWKKTYGMIVDRPTAPAKDPIQITLGPKTHVTGMVTDALTGKPIDHFTVMPGVINPVYGMDQTYWNNESWAGTVDIGQNGQFTYSPDQPYPLYQLRVQAPGYLSCDSAPFDNVSDELALQFKLVKGVGITGTVFDANHKPLPGAMVHLVLSNQPLQIQNHGSISVSGQEIPPMQTDSTGHFGFEPQVGAFDLVCVTPEGYARVDAPALHPEKAPSGTPERAQKQPTTRLSSYDLILQPWGTVKGKLMVGSNAGAHIGLGLQMINSNWDGHQPQVYLNDLLTTDIDGQFSFDHVPPGEVQVVKIIRNGDSQIYSAMMRLDIKPGETAAVHLGGTGRPIVGKFAIPSSFPRNNWIAWNASLQPHMAHLQGPPMPEMPLSIRMGSAEAKRKWLEQWIKTPEGKALIAAQIKWFKTPEGQASLAAAKKPIENVGQMNFSFAVQPDGTFRIDDVPAGSYEIFTHFFPAAIMNGGSGDWNHPLGTSQKEIVVPVMPGGRSDAAMDLGTIAVAAPPAQQ
ncbi:MAG TPA: carboxypeptidase-like regulatory domain-containing protein [Tepidisphaeraceae bacterium]|jgi:hypothetical protein